MSYLSGNLPWPPTWIPTQMENFAIFFATPLYKQFKDPTPEVLKSSPYPFPYTLLTLPFTSYPPHFTLYLIPSSLYPFSLQLALNPPTPYPYPFYPLPLNHLLRLWLYRLQSSLITLNPISVELILLKLNVGLKPQAFGNIECLIYSEIDSYKTTCDFQFY